MNAGLGNMTSNFSRRHVVRRQQADHFVHLWNSFHSRNDSTRFLSSQWRASLRTRFGRIGSRAQRIIWLQPTPGKSSTHSRLAGILR